MLKMKKNAFAVVATLLAATSAWSQDPVLNLYSARHYSTDEATCAACDFRVACPGRPRDREPQLPNA